MDGMTVNELIENLTKIANDGYSECKVLYKTMTGTFGIQKIMLEGETIEYTKNNKSVLYKKSVILE